MARSCTIYAAFFPRRDAAQPTLPRRRVTTPILIELPIKRGLCARQDVSGKGLLGTQAALLHSGYVGRVQHPSTPPPNVPYPSAVPPAAFYPQAYPYAGAPPRRRSAWFYVATIGGSFAVIVGVLSLAVWLGARSMGASNSGFSAGSQVGVIDITGVILDADKIDTQLRHFGEDSSVKAIVLHINSPGGGAAASQEIYHEVLRVRQENHKKIVASVESVGASGAYYIASACDRIYANDASVVGSPSA